MICQPAPVSGVERTLYPLQAAGVDRHHVEPAWRYLAIPQQKVVGRANDSLLLESGHASRCAAVRRARACAHFDEYQRSIVFAQDQIHFAAPGTWACGEPIIATHEGEPLTLQMLQCKRLGPIARDLA